MNPRIIAGKYKGRKLEVNEDTRPITDRMKQSLFDSLGELVEDRSVLDLYAGSGSIGIEALSRGAKHVTFVEKDEDAAHNLVSNCLSMDIPRTDYKVEKTFARKFVDDADGEITYDLIFIDPPFTAIKKFRMNKLRKIMNDQSIVVLKYPIETKLPTMKGLDLFHEEVFGSNKLLFYKKP
jgi:16S rRNA (guanine966-N2)-methyltransferase